MNKSKKEHPQLQAEALLSTLQTRFAEHMNRHQGITWDEVETKLRTHPEKLWSLNEMARTGGEPDVVGFDQQTGEILFIDCSEQTPAGRRSLCYDQLALESRKKNKPEGSAMEMAAQMGVALLTEEEYQALQELGEFDTTTSSWLKTPFDIRERGGAIYGDRRYGRVFIYHNGAESYYASRGFRGVLRV